MCCRFSPLFMSKSPFFGQLPMAKLYACKREAEGQTVAQGARRDVLGSTPLPAAACARQLLGQEQVCAPDIQHRPILCRISSPHGHFHHAGGLSCPSPGCSTILPPSLLHHGWAAQG